MKLISDNFNDQSFLTQAEMISDIFSNQRLKCNVKLSKPDGKGCERLVIVLNGTSEFPTLFSLFCLVSSKLGVNCNRVVEIRWPTTIKGIENFTNFINLPTTVRKVLIVGDVDDEGRLNLLMKRVGKFQPTTSSNLLMFQYQNKDIIIAYNGRVESPEFTKHNLEEHLVKIFHEFARGRGEGCLPSGQPVDPKLWFNEKCLPAVRKILKYEKKKHTNSDFMVISHVIARDVEGFKREFQHLWDAVSNLLT